MNKLKTKAKQNSENLRPKFDMEKVFNFLESLEDLEKFNSLDEEGQELFLKQISFTVYDNNLGERTMKHSILAIKYRLESYESMLADTMRKYEINSQNPTYKEFADEKIKNYKAVIEDLKTGLAILERKGQ